MGNSLAADLLPGDPLLDHRLAPAHAEALA
jgi:hypothetical protein